MSCCCVWPGVTMPHGRAPSLSPSVFFGRGLYGNWSLPFLSITLHLKISCPSSPAVPMGRGMACPVPQVKIEMESDYDSDIDHHRPRDMSSETTLWSWDWTSCWRNNAQLGVRCSRCWPTDSARWHSVNLWHLIRLAEMGPIQSMLLGEVLAASAFKLVHFWEILLWIIYEIFKLFIYLYDVNSYNKRGNIYLYVLYRIIYLMWKYLS